MFFQVENLHKSFGGTTVLEDISFEVEHGEIVSIIGPSGAGKTTLLNIIAGLDQPDSGRLHFSHPPDLEHPVLMVFQDYVLFPNLTIFENVAFGLKVRKLSSNSVRQRVMNILSYFHLADKQDQYPNQLSAGQRQRVAIARAMVVNPAMLLLDEPFANLDRNLKMQTAEFIRDTQKEFGVTTISVTHDLEEAFVMSDRIGLVLDGRLVQYDRAAVVYSRPSSMEAARFLGPLNIVPRDMFDVVQAGEHAGEGTEELFVRPEGLEVLKTNDGPGLVTEMSFAGHYTKCRIEVGEKILVAFARSNGFTVGDRVRLRVIEHVAPEDG